jgi:serine/threonine protein kinase
VKEERVVISTHNSTMRTLLRLVALTAPFWAVYVPLKFLEVMGFFIHWTLFDQYNTVGWLLGSFSVGLTLTLLLLTNTLILSRRGVAFPPLKAATLDITKVRQVDWHWDRLEREAYMRFLLETGDYIDIHHLRFTPKKISQLKDALKQWAPRCAISVESQDIEDLIAFREKFVKPKHLSLVQTSNTNATDTIDIPYHPHKQFGEFFQSLGANERYFWYCWMTVLVVPCVLKIPDVIWGAIADFRGVSRWLDVPQFITILDRIVGGAYWVGVQGLFTAGTFYFSLAGHPFGICILIGMATLALIAFLMFLIQPNGLSLTRNGICLYYHWKQLVFFKKQYPWERMRAFQLDQFGDAVNPEKWRMQIKMKDGRTVNLKVEAIMGAEARETLLRTISQMAPSAVQDPALIRALMPAQRESYTELWLQSLAAPPKRNRLAPLGDGQRLKEGRYVVDRQLAIGGQGTAYLASEIGKQDGSFGPQFGQSRAVVLKEFVLPVYTSRAVRKQALEKFENEARILGDLDHPQIVKLIDYFLEDHRAYLVLDHIDGKSLRQLVQEHGPLSRKQIADLSMQMCTVLEYLHSLSPPVVHRDFTPENLILNRDGKLVLIDFNVAQQREWTTTGTVVGKHAYIPPEQFRGRPSAQSDLYAMGATLFYLCTGEDPDPITCSHPQRSNEAIAHEIDRIVAKLTAIELEDRYQTVADVRNELQILIDGTLDGTYDGAMETVWEMVTTFLPASADVSAASETSAPDAEPCSAEEFPTSRNEPDAETTIQLSDQSSEPEPHPVRSAHKTRTNKSAPSAKAKG